ncbi:hypothetical protein [Azorhizobium sp. AG788]|uniref:hypothetical protein n=1 Tax=Azorhizobium sp. AG788 TaxID=2183897 RepID=UPI00105CB735|nr:hypothetical protein [Azorhizobium sp. AG788]
MNVTHVFCPEPHVRTEGEDSRHVPEAKAGQAATLIRNVANLNDQKLHKELARAGLPHFETVEDCRKRQIRDNALMEAAGSIPSQLLHALRREECEDFDALPFDSGASHLAKRLYRAECILSATPLIEAAGQAHLLTAIDSTMRRPVGKLHTVSPARILRRIKDCLRQTSQNARAICGVEACFDLGADDNKFWAPHVHCVVAGINAAELRDSMRDAFAHSEVYRPTMVQPITLGEVARTIGYCTKRGDILRPEYTAKNGRKQRRKQRLRSHLQAEFASWTAEYRPKDFVALVGFKRNGHYLVTT